MAYLPQITNHSFQDRVAAVGTGLLRLAGLKPQESTVLLLLNDCIGRFCRRFEFSARLISPTEFLLTDLALASHSILSYTLSSSTLLTSVLDSHRPSAIVTHAFMLPAILELLYEHTERNVQHTIVVVGEPTAQALASVASNVTILKFADVEREGVRTQKILSPVPSACG